tara:strand:+ start:11421 stop:12248 length:828 start_codon:yes stop_codon:yes gene_type:complete
LRINFFLYIVFIQIIFAVELNVLTYNIHGLSPILAGDNPKVRIPKILNKSNNFDVILIQENWIFSDDELAKDLNEYVTIVSNKSKFNKPLKYLLNPNGSGLSLAIKNNIKILNTDEYSFELCSGWISKYNDCFATKGFQYVSIEIGEERIDIYNTHLDAGKSQKDIDVRISQLESLKNYIDLHSSSYPLIIGGDMNINFLNKESKKIINQFMADLNLKMINWSIDKSNNKYILDYIFYRPSEKTEITLEQGGVVDGLLGLSDHPPISGLFNIRKK